jgi:hypothetical protein
MASCARSVAVVWKPLATTPYMAYGIEAASARRATAMRTIATINSIIVTPR